jgi:predicted nucleotidyltransferase
MPQTVVGAPPTLPELRAVVPEFCRRHAIARLEAFGSVARGDAHIGSDVDLLVTFQPGVRPGLDFFGMADELESILGCKVDLLTRRSVEQDRNTIRRRLILEGTEEVYAG